MKLPRRPGSCADSRKIQELPLASQAGVFIQQRGSWRRLLWGVASLLPVCRELADFPPGLP